MKKRFFGLLLSCILLCMLIGGCTQKEKQEESKDNLKIGITIQSLENDYWASVMSKLEALMKEKEYDYTLVSCNDTPETQVSQIENFITADVDVIMVHPSDPEAIETVCKEALEADIAVMCWDDKMENTTVNWVLDNKELGKEIGKAAANFINEHYTSDSKAEVCVIGFPQKKIVLERQQGIEAGLEEYCKDNYEIVATTEGLEAQESQTNMETVLQAHPDCKVVVGTGAGPMIGANEALLQKYGRGNIPEDVGVITTDVTLKQLESLQAGDEAVRAVVGFEGSSLATAQACLDMIERAEAGEEDFSGNKHDIYRPTIEITSENITEIMEGM